MMEPKARSRAKVRNFASVEHLGPEAVAAYVDGELSEVAVHRARVHLVHCPECRAEIKRQQHVVETIRECNRTEELRAPSALMARLTGIATSSPLEPEKPEPRPGNMLAKLDVMLRSVRRRNGN